jgi:DNA-binding IclR family transcriptional regulator
MTEQSDRVAGPLSVTRVLRILQALSVSDKPLSLAELGRQVGAPKTSLIGLLRGLVELNFVTFSDGSYRLGGGAFDLASTMLGARQRLHVGDYTRAGMRDVNRRSHETVLYAVLNEDEPATMTYVDMIESRGAIRISVGIGDRSPLYCTAGGRVLLAAMPDAAVRRYLSIAPLNAISPMTETDPETLFALVRRAREEQFSCVSDEVVQGITGMAAPVRDSSRAVLGTLIVAGPTARMIEDEDKLRAIILEAAQGISLSLGYRGGEPEPR